MRIDEILRRIQEVYNLKSTDADFLRWLNSTTDGEEQAEPTSKAASTLSDRLKNARLTEKIREEKAAGIEESQKTKKKEKMFGNKLYEDILVRISRDDNINPNYIFFGKLPKTFDEKTVRKIRGEEMSEYESEMFLGVPFYADINANFMGFYGDVEHLLIPKAIYKETSKLIYTTLLDNDSMEPNIKSNSVVFVNTGDNFLTQNALFLVHFRGENFVKRVQKVDGHILLKSDNIRYNTLICEPRDIKIIGRITNSITVDSLL